MKKILRQLALLVVCMTAMYGQTHIVDTLRNPTDVYGTPSTVKGTYTVVSQNFSVDGRSIAKTLVTNKITAGVVDLYLAPNDTSTGSYYTVNYSISASGDTVNYSERWHVSTTSSTVTIPQVRLSTVVSPLALNGVPIPPSSGTYCLTSTNRVLGTWSTCGGGSTLGLSSLTNTTLLSLTNSTLLSLTN